MTHIIYTLTGDPTPLARPRQGGRYNNVHVIDSQAHIKLVAGIKIQDQHGDHPAYTGALELNGLFYFPAYVPYRKKHVAIDQWHTQKPLLTNLIRFIEDIGITCKLFADDAKIARIIAQKKFAKDPRIEFWFIPLKE